MQTRAIRKDIKEVILVEIDAHKDERGFFIESYNAQIFKSLELPTNFVQDNHSRSTKGVLRGIHYQDMTAPMGKLVRCTIGEILDVAVDLRVGSPTFGKWVSEILTEENMKQLYLPPGFGHAFLSLSERVDVQYKCTNFYNPESEGSILWDDPDIAIEWSEPNPVLSERDLDGISLADYMKNPAFKYGEDGL